MVAYDEALQAEAETDAICAEFGCTAEELFWRQAVRNGQVSAAEAYRITGRLPFTNDEIADENDRLRGDR